MKILDKIYLAVSKKMLFNTFLTNLKQKFKIIIISYIDIKF